MAKSPLGTPLTILLAIGLIVIIAWGVVQLGLVPTPSIQQAAAPEGNISLTVAYSDALLGSACTCTSLTNKNLYYLVTKWPISNVNDLAQLATGLSTTAQTVGIIPTYNGLAVFWANSGTTTDYIVPTLTKSQSGGLITDFQLVDMDADGNVDVIFKVDLHGRGINKDSAIGISLIIRTMDEDMGNNALSNPSDQDSIGTGTKQVTVEWKYGKTATTNLADNTGFSIGRTLITSNETTFEALFRLKDFRITFSGSVFNINTVGTITGDTGAKQWNIDIGVVNYRQTYYNILVGRKAGDPGTIALTATFDTFFTVATEAVTATLKVDGAKPPNTLDTQLTDAIVLGG